MEELVLYLKEKGQTISTMESATGGYIASAITNISGSSYVLKFSAVTYSNEFKIKMGVPKEVIDKYSVYSMECAREMSLNISKFTDSDYGVGVTGKINDYDPNNDFGDNATVFVSLYDKNNDCFYEKVVKVLNQPRVANKELIKNEFLELFEETVME